MIISLILNGWREGNLLGALPQQELSYLWYVVVTWKYSYWLLATPAACSTVNRDSLFLHHTTHVTVCSSVIIITLLHTVWCTLIVVSGGHSQSNEDVQTRPIDEVVLLGGRIEWLGDARARSDL